MRPQYTLESTRRPYSLAPLQLYHWHNTIATQKNSTRVDLIPNLEIIFSKNVFAEPQIVAGLSEAKKLSSMHRLKLTNRQFVYLCDVTRVLYVFYSIYIYIYLLQSNCLIRTVQRYIINHSLINHHFLSNHLINQSLNKSSSK